MIVEATPLAGLAMGFAGSAHCVAMCGGVASALDRVATGGAWSRLASHGLYAFGRVGSYSLLGALVGLLGQAFADALPAGFQLVVRWWVGALLIVVGISLMRVRALRSLEGVGASVWRRLQPLTRRIVRLPSPLRAIALGAIWGWLPCGLVYSAAGVATVTGSPGSGAMFMAAFGVGTLPAVLSLGTAATGLWSRMDRRRVQGVTGFLIALCGVWTIVGPLLIHTGHHAPGCH